MRHLGDISRISGYDAPVVDCVIGGSPCQDLSVAGKRAGLAGERSGLFMEQIRIIKEMRDADRKRGWTGQFVRPRYAIWENVPGALSSPGKGHNGEDFAAVLEEFVRVVEPEAPAVSVPDKGWPTAGCFYDVDGPLIQVDKSATLSTLQDQTLFQPMSGLVYDARGNGDGVVAATMIGDHQNRVTDYTSLCVQPVDAIPIHDKATRFQGGGSTRNGDGAGNGLGVGVPGAPSPTLSTADRHMVCCSAEPHHQAKTRWIVRRLTPLECERLQGYPDGWTELPQIDSMSEEEFRFWDGVRREAARIHEKRYKTPTVEGMVKWWNNMAKGDSPRYQSLGNSIALPQWKWIIKRMCGHYERDATMGSLFDGIGGFPPDLGAGQRQGELPVGQRGGAVSDCGDADTFPIGGDNMTLEEIRASNKMYLTPADIARVLGADPQTIRVTARTRPDLVGYPFTFVGNRMKIPRIPFLKFMEGGGQ